MTKNILQMLERTADIYGEKTAFSDEKGSILYKEVVAKAKSIATCLINKGIQKEAVAIIQDKSKEMLVSFMGVVYSGNFYIPIDTEMPNDRIEKIFSVVKPRVIISDLINMDKACSIHDCSNVLLYDNIISEDIDAHALSVIRDKAIDTDPVYALFTSGSTGVPKGVICCHRSVIDYADWLIDTFGFNSDTIFGNQTPFYFSMSVLDIYATIRSGAELHIIPKKLFAFPGKLLDYINGAKINSIYWVPTALCIVANLKALEIIKLPYLKNILFAGEAMPTKQLNIWRKYVPNALYANLFGPTEITDIGIFYIVDRELSDSEPVPIGKACDNVDYLILSDDNVPVNKGEKGELCIRGSFLAMGYYDNPEKTNQAFIQNPLNPHYPEIIYKTGDIVCLNENDELIYYGRKDFQIKHRGNRIELGEIENAVNSVPNMEMCACLYDSEKERIVLFYQALNVSNKDIRNHISDMIPSYMIPNIMICVDNMPKNQNGKIDRKKLLELYKSR